MVTNERHRSAVILVSPNVPSETTPSSCMLGYLIRVSCVAAKVFGDALGLCNLHVLLIIALTSDANIIEKEGSKTPLVEFFLISGYS